ncbi:hypothetical protein L1049_019917 [Liquidambar formosana]|uniref:Uncharacterized protein n=1 Tax=Liquidambar formosana TaxID=63359 RepID=A0AAP0SCC5_LIQFO
MCAGGKRKVNCILSSPLNVFNDWIQRNEIARRIKDITLSLEEIEKEKAKFQLGETSKSNEPEPPQTTSMVNESKVFGRSMDKEIITRKLLSKAEEETRDVTSISIVGMGGIGKTTLAQVVFNDDRVQNHFLLRIWVCVSKTFDERRIAKAIIEQVGDNVPEFTEWETLQQRLRSSVMGKRFLLVLDDVWTQEFSKWESLKLPLRQGAPGSRILITTRNEGVAVIVGSSETHTLGLLSEQDCWSLFRTIAFSGKRGKELESLEEIGKLISRKCKGLPLVAKTLGNLMLYRRTKQDWQNVLVNDTWNLLEGEEGNLSKPLLLSYYDLPSHLKQCFIICAIFPKGDLIKKDDLIKLWMANGFLSSKERRELEVVGEQYYDDLVGRSFFQDLEKDEDGNILCCKVHDFVHHFARSLVMNECFVMENEGEEESDCSKARHLTLEDSDEIPPSIYNAKSLRTLIKKGKQKRLHTIPRDFFNHLRRLRAIDLSHNSILRIPCEIEKLMHLRYLDLSGSPLEELPDAVSSLYNLQTLKLIDCHNLCKLPQGMENLVNLRHLEIDGTDSLTYLPKGVGRLRSLRTLSKFIVSKGSRGCQIEQLKDLNYLRERLRILGLGNLTSAARAAEAELRNKQHICGLVLDFRVQRGRGEDNSEAQERIEGVIEHLQPHQKLENLEISCYPGTRLPSFMGKLPCLEKLLISGMNRVKYMDHDFFGVSNNEELLVSFPKLKELEFHYMDEWELCHTSVTGSNDDTHSRVIIAPSLCDLTLLCCLRLKGLPHNLLPITLLRELCIDTCPNLTWTRSFLLLPHLEKLTLKGDAGVLSRSFSNRQISLPNLRDLKICWSPHWSLQEGFGQLTELQSLEIYYSRHIIYMSDELQYLTKLQKLRVIGCRILGPRCQENIGEDWEKISHIPCVHIEIAEEMDKNTSFGSH